MRAAITRLMRPASRLGTSVSSRPLQAQFGLHLQRTNNFSPASRSLPLQSVFRTYSSESFLPPPDPNSPSSESSGSESSELGQKIASFPLAEKPSYELTFTCKKCAHRSTHKVTKQAYHKGTVLIQCPGCQVRHLIADHLKIFKDKPTTIEDILREQGEKVKRGVKLNNGDVEILPEEETVNEESNAKGDGGKQ